MFTGIISELAKLETITKIQDLRYGFLLPNGTKNIKLGSSISCNGVCLTVVNMKENSFDVDISAETLNLTNLALLNIGEWINIEKSLKFGDEISGHLVTGHIDGLAELIEIQSILGSFKLSFKTQMKIISLIAKKGSIALDGISLTVNETYDDKFSVNIIPHTWENTNLRNKKVGDKLNLEIDIISRYVNNALKKIGN